MQDQDHLDYNSLYSSQTYQYYSTNLSKVANLSILYYSNSENYTLKYDNNN